MYFGYAIHIMVEMENMMPNDGQRRRAESAEALLVAAVVTGDENYHNLLQELIESESNLERKSALCVNRTAESAAYQRLSEEIINELKNPNLPRRLSDPDNEDAREKFLVMNHRAKITVINAQLKRDGIETNGSKDNLINEFNNASFKKYKNRPPKN